LLEAFSISSVTGCLSEGTWALTGSSGFGAEISTPGKGPATVGLSGVELFDALQPAADSARDSRA
jgi:hypothetical protein